MAASIEPSEDGHNIVLSDVHVHAERSSQSILQSISERHHSEEKSEKDWRTWMQRADASIITAINYCLNS